MVQGLTELNLITWNLKDELIQQEILHSELKRKNEFLVQEFAKYKESAHKEIEEVEKEFKGEVNEKFKQLRSSMKCNDKLKKNIANIEKEINKLKNTQPTTTKEHTHTDAKCTSYPSYLRE
jgi:vacuolar-type H+-ATPase subunit D/Vma8